MSKPIRVEGAVAYIPLSKGLEAKIDAALAPLISSYSWCANSRGYAVRNGPRIGGKRETIYMHRVIAGTPMGMETDHINGDKLDNRSANLRVVTTSQNQWNRGATVKSLTGVKGVSWYKRLKKWRVATKVCGKSVHVGVYETLELACQAQAVALSQLHGPYAARTQAALNQCVEAYNAVRGEK